MNYIKVYFNCSFKQFLISPYNFNQINSNASIRIIKAKFYIIHIKSLRRRTNFEFSQFQLELFSIAFLHNNETSNKTYKNRSISYWKNSLKPNLFSANLNCLLVKTYTLMWITSTLSCQTIIPQVVFNSLGAHVAVLGKCEPDLGTSITAVGTGQ